MKQKTRASEIAVQKMLLGKKNVNKLFLLTTIIVIRSDNLKMKRFYLRTAVHIFLVAAVCKKSVSFSVRAETESFRCFSYRNLEVQTVKTAKLKIT